MCGRYTLNSAPNELHRLLDSLGTWAAPLPAVEARFNIAPTQAAWAALPAHNTLQLQQMGFGFRPSYISHGVINARAETITHKPLFRKAFAHARCLVLASGFYEWAKAPDGSRRPHHFSLVSGKPFVFAGLSRVTQPNDPGHGKHAQEFVIITTQANACVAAVHPRMPVILPPEAARMWLARQAEPPALESLLVPLASDAMVARPVSTRVNRATLDDATCLEPPSG